MGRVDQLQFDYELRESDATTKIIYNQGAEMDWQSTLCSMAESETVVMALDGNFNHQPC